MKRLEIYLPAHRSAITQGFSENANASYKESGLIGHTAIDWAFLHGAPVPNCVENAYCYSVMNKDNPDPDKYRAVFTLVNADNGVSEWAEVSYGHADQIFAEVGKTYQPGDTLMTAGNTGTVYSGGRLITKAEKLRGSTAGTHLHGPQVRPVKRVKKTSRKKQYLSDGFGLLKKDGYYFEIINYENGTNGCINPAPFLNDLRATAPKFTKDLYIGIQDPEVREVQKFLNRNGFRVAWIGNGSPGRETDYFGILTENALKRFQAANGISPASGYWGPITRRFISGS
jgi:hypothetical protein